MSISVFEVVTSLALLIQPISDWTNHDEMQGTKDCPGPEIERVIPCGWAEEREKLGREMRQERANEEWTPIEEQGWIWGSLGRHLLLEPRWVPADQPTGNDKPGSWRALQL